MMFRIFFLSLVIMGIPGSSIANSTTPGTDGLDGQIAEIVKEWDHFYIRLSGFLKVPTSGQYTFYLAADDGAALYIDGEREVDDTGGYDRLRVPELQSLLNQRGLKVSGRRAELIERLQEDDECVVKEANVIAATNTIGSTRGSVGRLRRQK